MDITKGGYSEEIQNYFIADLHNAPGNGHTIVYSPVRVVCFNTLTMAKSRSNFKIKIPHTGDPGAIMNFIANTVGHFDKHQADTKALFEQMMATPIKADDFAGIVAKTFPYPKKPGKVRFLEGLKSDQRAAILQDAKQRAVLTDFIGAEDDYKVAIKRADTLRELTRELAQKFNDEHPAVANTVWMAYQATTENSDWREGRENEDIGKSVLFGLRSREKVRAFDACVKAL
jgi:hypothetical protein